MGMEGHRAVVLALFSPGLRSRMVGELALASVEHRMTILKRSIGFGTSLLAVLGLLLCVGGIIGVWLGKSRVDAVGTAVFGATDDALAFVDVKFDRVKEVVERSRHRVSGISRIAERLTNAKADARKDCESLLQALDDVYQGLKSAESWLDSSHAVASGVSRVSAAVASSDLPPRVKTRQAWPSPLSYSNSRTPWPMHSPSSKPCV